MKNELINLEIEELSSEELAEQIYSEFCENPDQVCQLQKCWDEYQLKYGEIENGSITEKLIVSAMTFALDYLC